MNKADMSYPQEPPPPYSDAHAAQPAYAPANPGQPQAPYPAAGAPPPAQPYPPAGGPPTGQYPPPQGQYPPPQGQYPPPQGQYPPPQGQYPPPQGQYPPPQGQNAPPTGMNTNTTVVVAQPTVVTTIVQQFREAPINTNCPSCHAQVVTSISFETGTFAWLLCVILCVVGLDLGCCLIPFCVDGCKDVHHTCPNCGHLISKWSRM